VVGGESPLNTWFGLLPKAKENLTVAETCVETGQCNVAASRFYWASFLAVAWALAGRGTGPDSFKSGAKTWDHTMVFQNLKSALPDPGDKQHRRNYAALKGLREKADYAPDDVSKEELARLDSWVGALQARLGL
jgi:uncharacterized protein (UPF0332 family)